MSAKKMQRHVFPKTQFKMHVFSMSPNDPTVNTHGVLICKSHLKIYLSPQSFLSLLAICACEGGDEEREERELDVYGEHGIEGGSEGLGTRVFKGRTETKTRSEKRLQKERRNLCFALCPARSLVRELLLVHPKNEKGKSTDPFILLLFLQTFV